MSTVITRDESQRRYLLEPVLTNPENTDIKIYVHPSKVPEKELQIFEASPLVALDFETRGNDISDPLFKAVGVGLSNGSLSIYISFKHCSTAQKQAFLKRLAKLPIIGHNVYFDGGVFYKEIGEHANWQFCTFGLFKQLSSESQLLKWGLKGAQTELLGWQDTNEVLLDQWLVDNGYHKGILIDPKEQKNWYYSKETDRWHRPLKGEMHRAPDRILGHYCCLDAYSTFLLYTRVLEPAMKKIDKETLVQYHYQDFLPLVEVLIEAWKSGIPIDKDACIKHAEYLRQEIESSSTEFLEHEKIKEFVKEFNDKRFQEYLATEPEKIKKAPKLSTEPAKYKKNGELSKNWEKWEERRLLIEKWDKDPANISKNWLSWRDRKADIKGFNLNSAIHLRELFYDKLGYPVRIKTKSELPAVDGDALKLMGPEVRSFERYKDLFKELGYVDKCIEKARQDKDGIWRIHAQYIVPGTLTGRLAGSGGLNCFPEHVEILTKRGWIGCTEVREEDQVYSVNAKEQVGRWTFPTAVINKHYTGRIYKFNSLEVTEDHRMAWYNTSVDHNYKFTAQASDLFPQKKLGMATSTKSTRDEETELTYSEQEIQLACMLQAGGHKKERKVELATKYEYEKQWQYMWNYIKFSSPLLCAETKTFNLSTLSTDCAEVFVGALRQWDSYSRNTKSGAFQYSSCIKKNVDEVQAYLTRAGYTCNLHTPREFEQDSRSTTYNLYIRPRVFQEFKKENLQTYAYSGQVGCVTVPDGHIMVRSKGKVYVTGNCQQLPKSRGYLECWKPMDKSNDYTWLDCDWSSLEPTVIAELTRDPGMLNVYGPNAKHTDIYLYFGSNVPAFRKIFEEAGYFLDAPTPEGIKNAKKKCKATRNICKTVVLAKQYRAGARKIHSTLTLNGVEMDIEEVAEICRKYDDTFKGVKQFSYTLEKEWKERGGWVYNGVGRPITVAEDQLKDLVNRNCLAGDTQVLTKEQGWKKITEVTRDDKVWDGVEWVSHRGLIYQGSKTTIDFNGIRCTPDHKILTKEGMKEAKDVTVDSIETEIKPRYSWSEFWRLCSSFGKEVAKEWTDICRRYLQSW